MAAIQTGSFGISWTCNQSGATSSHYGGDVTTNILTSGGITQIGSFSILKPGTYIITVSAVFSPQSCSSWSNVQIGASQNPNAFSGVPSVHVPPNAVSAQMIISSGTTLVYDAAGTAYFLARTVFS